MLQSTDSIPMNFGFTGKGNTAKPEGLKEVKQTTTVHPLLLIFLDPMPDTRYQIPGIRHQVSGTCLVGGFYLMTCFVGPADH